MSSFDQQTIRQEFLNNGYVVLEDFFPRPQMEKLCTMIIDHFGLDPQDTQPDNLRPARAEVVAWRAVEDGQPDFVAVAEDPRLHETTQAILDGDYEFHHSLVMFSKAHSAGQAWHQDCVVDNPEHFNLNRLIYVHDILPEQGGQIVVVPGSHRWGEIPPGGHQGDIEGQVYLAPKAGTIVFVHGMTYHRVTPIVGDQPRFSFNLRVRPTGTPANITDVGVYRNMKYRFSTKEVVAMKE